MLLNFWTENLNGATFDAFCASADVKCETIFKSMVLVGSGGASRGWWDIVVVVWKNKALENY